MWARREKVSIQDGNTKKEQTLKSARRPFYGARGETRTHTLLPETDFESVASANSATRAKQETLYQNLSVLLVSENNFLLRTG